jgi:hypothetical protein
LRQGERLSLQLRELQEASIKRTISGAFPEQVLVLETVGSVEGFLTAVRKVPGMEWLVEVEEENIPPDEDFFRDDSRRDELLSGRLYLILSNQEALGKMLSLWERYRKSAKEKFDRGLNKWREVFKRLKTIRCWGTEDRLRETGLLEDWEERVRFGNEFVRFEAELWFHDSPNRRKRSVGDFLQILKSEGGRLIAQSVIPEIAYHGLLGEIPVAAAQIILSHPETELVKCDHVMFFSPVGQAAVISSEEETLPGVSKQGEPVSDDPPVVALLDGLPIENHQLLKDRLFIDDPDDLGVVSPSQDRIHGTAMASLVIHGDLELGEPPLKRQIYLRPILKPDLETWRPKRESITEDILAVDLVHRAVKRIFEGDGDQTATAPTVKVINFSIGDLSRPFDRFMSPLARLLDWLSVRHNVLFVVSAGNRNESIGLDMGGEELRNATPSQIQSAAVKAMRDDARRRRILSPAESINALTVGAAHQDGSQIHGQGGAIDPIMTEVLPSPLSPMGLGYRRSIKPDVLFPGGRQLYRERPFGGMKGVLEPLITTRPPGQRTASPGKEPGNVQEERFSRGTSNSAALASRLAAKCHAVLEDLRRTHGGDSLKSAFDAVLIKAMVAHGARWGRSVEALERAIGEKLEARRRKDLFSRFLGYGRVDDGTILSCTEQRATLLGWGSLEDEKAHAFKLPIPPSLNGRTDYRCLTLTLAWFSPVLPKTQKYRAAQIWCDFEKDTLQVDRSDVDWLAAMRGTLQHEILEGESAAVFAEGSDLEIKVNCRQDAGKFSDPVRYGLVVSLQVAEGVEIPIYEEIQARIRPAVRVNL